MLEDPVLGLAQRRRRLWPPAFLTPLPHPFSPPSPPPPTSRLLFASPRSWPVKHSFTHFLHLLISFDLAFVSDPFRCHLYWVARLLFQRGFGKCLQSRILTWLLLYPAPNPQKKILLLSLGSHQPPLSSVQASDQVSANLTNTHLSCNHLLLLESISITASLSPTVPYLA